MPSTEHEALVLLFRNLPELAAELLTGALGVSLPPFTEARVTTADRTEVRSAAYRADLVVELRSEQQIVAAVIVEVQRSVDPQKKLTWPLYLASVRAELGCPALLLVVTPDPDVQRWASQPIPMGHPNHALTPVVLGPADVPVVMDREWATRLPELAVLSSLAHGNAEGHFEVVLAAIHAALELDEDRGETYVSFILTASSEAVRARLEREMKLGNYMEPTDLEKRILARGRALGLAEGRAEGEAEGKAEGEAKGRAEGILTVLVARGLDVPEEVRAAVLSCRDPDILEAWLVRAATCEQAEDVTAPD